MNPGESQPAPELPESGSIAAQLDAFRLGDPTAGDRLLDRYRPWLRLLAKVEVESQLRAKFDPSDVVQQTLIEACRAAPQFRGTTEAEWRSWLRQILYHALAHEIRRFRGAQKRDVHRERSLEEEMSQASQNLGSMLASPDPSPTGNLARQERDLMLARVLEQLPEDYREVIVLRHFEGLSHEEIAERLGRRPGAVRMLWIRALARLREEAGRHSLDGSQPRFPEEKR